ncbi:hypothetical protein Cch01nite_22270 [Cellulomonas chitinilytica]|uniref:Uncharacterized protein n=1 Tax=Cellulomonas chitinilytica TaxID=398759 RepID=A0A919U037_9CELL|nr:hypothetical protein Cch01nite_22270 [Cellulomonas chitinilytica]
MLGVEEVREERVHGCARVDGGQGGREGRRREHAHQPTVRPVGDTCERVTRVCVGCGLRAVDRRMDNGLAR